MTITKSGFVAIIGRPNVGKSTLLNELLGEKLSITSHKPQTTRWQVLGIKTLPEHQIIYVDTPGLHKGAKKAVNRYMNRVARTVILDADVILFLVDVTHWHHEDEAVLTRLKQSEKPVILVLNKIDLLKNKTQLLPIIDEMKNKMKFSHVIPISALKKENVMHLEQALSHLLPAGPQLFPEDQHTDKSEKFLIAETIREKIIRVTEQEIPYATAIEIEAIKQKEKITEIDVVIWVERPGQKVIVIGKKGALLKKIGMLARKEIERLLDTKIYLNLWVKVKPNWTDNEKALKSLGYE